MFGVCVCRVCMFAEMYCALFCLCAFVCVLCLNVVCNEHVSFECANVHVLYYVCVCVLDMCLMCVCLCVVVCVSVRLCVLFVMHI